MTAGDKRTYRGQPMNKLYVVYWIEHLRDGNEEGAKIVETVDEGLSLIDKLANGFAGCNMDFKLFELGKEISIVKGAVEAPQPAKKVVKFVVRDS